MQRQSSSNMLRAHPIQMVFLRAVAERNVYYVFRSFVHERAKLLYLLVFELSCVRFKAVGEISSPILLVISTVECHNHALYVIEG